MIIAAVTVGTGGGVQEIKMQPQCSSTLQHENCKDKLGSAEGNVTEKCGKVKHDGEMKDNKIGKKTNNNNVNVSKRKLLLPLPLSVPSLKRNKMNSGELTNVTVGLTRKSAASNKPNITTNKCIAEASLIEKVEQGNDITDQNIEKKESNVSKRKLLNVPLPLSLPFIKRSIMIWEKLTNLTSLNRKQQ